MTTLKDQAKEIGVHISTFKNWIKTNNVEVNQKGNSKWIDEKDFLRAKEVLTKEKLARLKTEFLKSRGLRECKKCKKEDKKENFRPDENLCNDCYKKKMNDYYDTNKDVLKIKNKEYYENHKEQHRVAGQIWRDKNREKHRQSANEYQKKNKSKCRLWHVKWKFGLTKHEYQAMLDRCDGNCNICRMEMNKVCVDHDHNTGDVRDLLCRDCNFILGDLRDDINLIYRAIKYLLYSNTKECYKYKYASSSKVYRKREYYLSILGNPTTCEICGEVGSQMHIDHDHFNKRIRGYLCNHCNHALGHARDSVMTLANAIVYLEKHASTEEGGLKVA